MRLALDEEETRIADEAHKVLTGTVPLARLHHENGAAFSGDARRTIAELGWFSLTLAEDAGGAGMSEVEFALFFREAGRQCAPIELLCQSLATLLTADNPELCAGLSSGKYSVALLLEDAEGKKLLGTPGDFVLEVTPGSARLLDLKGQPVKLLTGLDPAVPMHQLDGYDLPVLHQISDATASNTTLWHYGQLAVAAMLVGISEAALAQILEYAKIRETFGKPIGAYQAVRHPCADMATRLEAARCQLWFAAAALTGSQPDAIGHLNAAKHLANECAAFVTDLNIQLHGGIGVTDEHDAHIFMKHALLLRKLFGSKRLLLNDLLHAHFGT